MDVLARFAQGHQALATPLKIASIVCEREDEFQIVEHENGRY